MTTGAAQAAPIARSSNARRLKRRKPMSAQLSAPVPTTVSRTVPMKMRGGDQRDDELCQRRPECDGRADHEVEDRPDDGNDEVRDRDDRPEDQERGGTRVRRAARPSFEGLVAAGGDQSQREQPRADEETPATVSRRGCPAVAIARPSREASQPMTNSAGEARPSIVNVVAPGRAGGGSVGSWSGSGRAGDSVPSSAGSNVMRGD